MSSHNFVLATLVLGAACGGSTHQNPDGSGGTAGNTGGSGGSIGGAGGSVGGNGGVDGGPNIVQTCVPPPAIDQPAAKLSQTGCMDPADTKKMAASVIPYDVNSPLWSDGAEWSTFSESADRRFDSGQPGTMLATERLKELRPFVDRHVDRCHY